MDPIEFSVPVSPMAITRIVTRRRTIGTAGKCQRWKGKLAHYARRFKPDEPLDCPVYATVVFIHARPKYMEHHRYPDSLILKATKPDYDNLAKLPIDALDQDEWLTDDGRIAAYLGVKMHVERGGKPRIVVRLSDTPPDILSHMSTPLEWVQLDD